jgi:CMP-N-acetylneuraminic acid synthetase
MYRDKRTLCIIPARGGSKGLPRKNIKTLHGKPLIAWTIETALGSGYPDRVIVNTDDSEIAGIARQFGADVPFMRPLELAADDSDIFDVIEHTVEFFDKQGENFDIISILEPTSPLRNDGEIDNAIKLLVDNIDRADSVISVGEVHLESPYVVKRISEEGYLMPVLTSDRRLYRRQDVEKTYFPYGIIYIAFREPLLEGRSFYTSRTIPMFIERWQNYEIDDIYDFLAVEAAMAYRQGQNSA